MLPPLPGPAQLGGSLESQPPPRCSHGLFQGVSSTSLGCESLFSITPFWRAGKAPKRGLDPQRWWQDLFSFQKGIFYFFFWCPSSHPEPAPPRDSEVLQGEKGPGSIPLLEDIKKEQPGAAQGGQHGPREQRGAVELLTFGNRGRRPRASPVPIRGWARGRK